jgi:hypothetical protein
LVSVRPAPLYDFRVTRGGLEEGPILPAEWTSLLARFPELVGDPQDPLVGRWNGFRFRFENGVIRGDAQNSLVVTEARRIAAALGAKCFARSGEIGRPRGPWREQDPVTSRLGDTVVAPDSARATFYCALCGANILQLHLWWDRDDRTGDVPLRLWTPTGENTHSLTRDDAEEVSRLLVRLDAGHALAERDAGWAPGFCAECNAFFCSAHWASDPPPARCTLRGHVAAV